MAGSAVPALSLHAFCTAKIGQRTPRFQTSEREKIVVINKQMQWLCQGSDEIVIPAQ